MAEDSPTEDFAFTAERDPGEATNRARKILHMEGARVINDEDYLGNREGFKIFREQVVSKGKFAQYYAARSATGVDVVVKVIPFTALSVKYKDNLLKTGHKILSYLKANPNSRIAAITAIYMTKLKFYVFYEPLGSDLEKLARKRAYQEQEFKSWIMDILRGLNYLYDHCIGHRNIQASNVVLTADMSIAKLTGFGNAIVTWNPEKMSPVHAEKEKEFHSHLAPETLKGDYDAHIADIWGVGAIISVLISRKACFDKKTTEFAAAWKTHCRRNEVSVSSDLDCFLCRIFISEPGQRAPLHELATHHWFGGDANHNH